MTPEQSGLLITAVLGLVIAVIGAIVALFRWLPSYIKQVTDEGLKDREQKRVLEKLETDTELEGKRIEAEVEARQSIAQAEAFEKTITMFSQVLERHAATDERNATTAEKRIEVDKQKIESDNRLANAIDTLTRSSNTSQLWQENRANDFIDTANLINERVGGLERVGKSAIEAIDRIEVGLNEARSKLNKAIENHPNLAQQSTLLAIQTQLTSLTLMVESLAPKPNGDTVPLDETVLKQVETPQEKPIEEIKESNDNEPPMEKTA